jgi:predicted transposase/invertase (TIGR01784 family)
MLFGDEQHKDILATFLRAVLPPEEHDDYVNLVLKNPFLWGKPAEKMNILDIRLETARGKRINVEIQISPQRAFCERILFYAARLLTEQLGEGEEYHRLQPTISIVITDFILRPQTVRYHNCYRMCNVQGDDEFSRLMQIDVLELPKLPLRQDDQPLWAWLKFLTTQDEEELKMLAQKNPDLEKAVTRLEWLSQSEEAHDLYEARCKMRRDIASEKYDAWLDGQEDGMIKGLVKGREEGREEERKHLARKLLQRGRPIAEIMEDTGLSELDIAVIEAETATFH